MSRGIRSWTAAALCALALVAPALAQEPDAVESRRVVNESTELLGKKKPREALKLLEGAKGKITKADLWVWWGNQGLAHRKLGDLDRALACFGKSFEVEPSNWFYEDRAEIHHLRGDWDSARADIDRAKKYYQDKGQPLPRRAAILNVVVNGPFKADYPNAWRKCETTSKYGHFRVCSNAGVPRELLQALEKKCAALDPGKPGDLKKIEKLCTPSKQVVSVATLMEIMRKEYMGIVNMKEKDWPTGRVFKVFYFEDAGDFETFNVSMGEPDSESMAGYYDPNFHYLALYNQPGGDLAYGFTEETMDTFFHEGWHQFYHVLSEDPPIWLNEGLAVFLGPSQVLAGGRKIKLGGLRKRSTNPEAVSNYENIKEAVRKGTHVPFKTFFRIDSAKWHAGDKHLYYAQSWAICYYALRGNNKTFTADFLKFFWETTKNRPQDELIDELFPDAKLEAYEKAWLAFMKKL